MSFFIVPFQSRKNVLLYWYRPKWYRPIGGVTMNIIKVNNASQGAARAYDIFAETLTKGATVFGLATGSTPVPLYQRLVESPLDFSQATAINLDEYLGLSGNDPQSYHFFMAQHLFNHKAFKQTFIPDGKNPDRQAATSQYDRIIEENPIDLQLLGLGRNGHIGFNEPGTAFDSKTHIVDLTQSTIDANARFFDHEVDVPTQAISMGIGSVMSAKHILLMAFGAEKADAVAQMISGPITEKLPASVLQQHPNVTVIIDDAAAAKL